jgi:radical SAM protein with 4Fe4S-binding SPASM domain
MSIKGRAKLFLWNYSAVFNTIRSSKEYIAAYITGNSIRKSIRKISFNSAILLSKWPKFISKVYVTDFNHMHLGDFFKTLHFYGVRNADIEFIDPMRMEQKSLSFTFMMNFPKIKKDIEAGQKLGVITKAPKKKSLLSIISSLSGNVASTVRPSSKKENYEKIKSDIENEKQAVSAFPSKLFIELTRNCNCSCIMCGRLKPSYDENLNMDLKLFKDIADYFFPYADYVDLRGFGESTLIKNIDEYISYALKYRCDFGLITNLTVRNDPLWEKLILHNFWIGVSFDAANKETYGRIRRFGNFENVLYNFDLIMNISIKHSIKNRLYLIVTVQKDNIEELDDIIRTAKKYSIQRVELSPVISPHDNDPYSLSHVRPKVKENIRKALRLAKELGIETRLIGTFDLEEQEKASGHELMKRCPRPWSWLYVNYDGKIGPCNHLMDPLFVLGDLSAEKSDFHKVLNNESFQLMRAITHTSHRYKSCDWCFKNRYDY